MVRWKTMLVWACLFVTLPITVFADCPRNEDVAPCTCQYYSYNEVEIRCDKIEDESLIRVTRNLKGEKVYSFSITGSTFSFIPHDVFEGIKVRRLEIDRSTLAALTDKGEAFVGLEDHLEYIAMRYCDFKNEWDWSVMRNLRKLRSVFIVKSLRLETLGTEVMKISLPPSLALFFFDGNNVSFVSDHAFDSFEEASHLILSNNGIKHVKRTMLPSPALNLRDFDISGNQIEEIPEDMFTKMPNLRSLNIDFNKIVVLNEVTFSPIWEQLSLFSTFGNPLRCECSMQWILKDRIPKYFLGECASPPELKGKKLTKLKLIDLVCKA